ncbi:MAG: iron-sulfur cluster co-chaperone HscB C-terminal domain-containing protein [Planctomycetota bacterium]|jgi:molecular chaperone HscB
MNDATRSAIPSKCDQCDKPMSTPLVCDFCHALNPAGAEVDYFTLLGLPQTFDLTAEQVREKFLALNRHAHPDFHSNETPEVQALSLRVSANVNDAFRVLSDAASRANYLLELLGGPSPTTNKSVPDGFLGTMMMMQEEIADAQAAEQSDELARIREVLQTQHDGLMNRIEGLYREYQKSVDCEAVRQDLLGEIRRQLNAVSYVKKLLSQTR